jgi:lipoprotein-anchoring transpeptidase ErfK/SrfK
VPCDVTQVRQDVALVVTNGAKDADVRRSCVMVMVVAVMAPAGLTACRDDETTARPAGGPATTAPPAALAAFSLTVTPTKGKKGVAVSAEIGTKIAGGRVTAVKLREVGGGAVPGALRDDRSAWVPARPLKHNKRYEAVVTAADASGQPQTASTSFITMARPSRETGTGLYMFDGNTYGVAMPVVVEFIPGIKKKDRPAVQKRMFVKTSPPQTGTWSWTASGSQAYYRAPKYWKTGTTLSVRIGVGGLPTGGGRYGDQDRSATAKIGRSFIMKVDNKTKKMTVSRDGKTVRTMPVSLGKKSTPSSSGTMVVMEKKARTIFDTRAELGSAGYVTDIEFAQRLTWSGQYIHSAPWSVGSQGHHNVSHGCVNVSPANARWLFDKTLIGDPVTVRGTGDTLASGNGWTAWDMSWDEFAAGSALPLPVRPAASSGA